MAERVTLVTNGHGHQGSSTCCPYTLKNSEAQNVTDKMTSVHALGNAETRYKGERSLLLDLPRFGKASPLMLLSGALLRLMPGGTASTLFFHPQNTPWDHPSHIGNPLHASHNSNGNLNS